MGGAAKAPPIGGSEMQIWVLYSVANCYGQPENNLEGFWEKRPGWYEIRKALLDCGRFETTEQLEEATSKIFSLKVGKDSDYTRFRLEIVSSFQ